MVREGPVCILGGTGFVGRHLVARLAAGRRPVRVLTRRRRPGQLAVLPGVELVEVDPYDPEALASALVGASAVINLVGILNEAGSDGSGFRRAHVELTQRLVEACRANRIRRLLQLSALGANADQGPSHYLRSKGEALRLLRHAPDLQVTTFSPSVIFGDGDSFFNRFAGLLRMAPGVFPLVGAKARFAPLHVGDLVACMVRALGDSRTHGKDYELCGPRSYTLQELVAFTARTIGVRRLILPLAGPLARLQAWIMEWLPGKPLSRDNLDSMRRESVCTGAFPELFGIAPASIESVVPRYLGRRTRQAGYDRMRKMSGG